MMFVTSGSCNSTFGLPVTCGYSAEGGYFVSKKAFLSKETRYPPCGDGGFLLVEPAGMNEAHREPGSDSGSACRGAKRRHALGSAIEKDWKYCVSGPSLFMPVGSAGRAMHFSATPGIVATEHAAELGTDARHPGGGEVGVDVAGGLAVGVAHHAHGRQSAPRDVQ